MFRFLLLCIIYVISIYSFADVKVQKPITVTFSSGDLTLKGELFLPQGKGPFPIVLYNHGSAPKMLNSFASAAIAPNFIQHGWGFFMPYRRGQGLSENQGPYIMDEIRAAGVYGINNAVKTLISLHKNEHLSDQTAALKWLQKQPFTDINNIATFGNSFGGIQVLLAMEQDKYCAGISASAASQSWADSDELQRVMKQAVENTNNPIFFFQAENDYDLSPSNTLSLHMTKLGKITDVKIYPAFGKSAKQGHSFPYTGVSVWFSDALMFINTNCNIVN